MRQAKDDRRTRRTRRLIVDALVALMVEKRYDRITMQEIVDRADVGRSTFYAQFQNKEDVLACEMERIFDLLHKQHLMSAVEPASQLLPSLGLFQHLHQQRPLHLALVRGRAIDAHHQAVHRHLRDRAARQLALVASSGVLALPPDIIADYLANALLSQVRWWLDNGLPYSPDEMEAIFQQLTMPGIRAVISGRQP